MLHLTKQEGTMPINDNLARVMRRFKRKERLSVQALSERLGITKIGRASCRERGFCWV